MDIEQMKASYAGGYGLDKDEVEYLFTQAARLAAVEQEKDEEVGRWQEAIRGEVVKCSGASDCAIDGSGCDSGDPLDLSLAEIAQGFAHVEDVLAELQKDRDDLRAQLEREKGERERYRAVLEAAGYQKLDDLATKDIASCAMVGDAAAAITRAMREDLAAALEEVERLKEHVSDIKDDRDLADAALQGRDQRIEALESQLAAAQLHAGTAREVARVFEQMVADWCAGRHVTKLCYGLNNEHMKALDALCAAIRAEANQPVQGEGE